MRVAIGADHAGYDLKEMIKEYVSELGNEVVDVGTYSCERVDYPDFAWAVGEAIIKGKSERGILICGSGVGASVAANKIPGIRASVCHDSYSARQGVEHDNMNVLTLGARVVGGELAKTLVTAFLNAQFGGEDRYVRRLNKIAEIEKHYRGNS